MADAGVVISLPPDASAELVARIRAAFPEAALAAPAGDAPDIEIAAGNAVAAAYGLPAALDAWWASLGGGAWPALAFAAALAGGVAAEALARRLVGDAPAAGAAADPFTRRARRAAWWGGRQALLLAVFYAAASALAAMIPGGSAALTTAIRTMLGVVVYARGLFVLIDALSAAEAPGRRLMGFAEPEAMMLKKAGRLFVTGVAFAMAARMTAALATGGGEAGILARVAFLGVGSILAAWFLLRAAGPVRTLALRSIESEGPAWLRPAALRLDAILIGAVILDFAIKAAGLLGALGPRLSNAGGPTLLAITLTPLAIAGLRVWRVEHAAAADMTRPGGRGIAEGAFAIAKGLTIIVGVAVLLRAWGLDPFAPAPASGPGRLLSGFVGAALSIVVGVALWRMVVELLAGAAPAKPGVIPDEERGGRVGGRMATIRLVLRGFLLAVIVVVTAMTALTALGANIGPLLASAGVVGLAIGFGAQKLVADIISGLFYLYEDAFRVGEYIECKGGKGLVERITLRSVILRHPRGPIYTIPFSDLGGIQNHSRDWVKTKFSFAVPSDVDLEMLRKTVKKVGEALAVDPELAGVFLEPLKSQGAVGIEGRSYLVGCKFTTRPGEQFLARRKIYAALQKALNEKGIELFAPQLVIAPHEMAPGHERQPAA